MTRNPEPPIVEETLHEIIDKAALVRYLTAVRLGDEIPDASVLSGLNDVCSEIEELAGAVRRSIPVGALMAPIIADEDEPAAAAPPPRRRDRSRRKRTRPR